MRILIICSCILAFFIGAFALMIALHDGMLTPKRSVVWDLTNSRSPSAIQWPMDSTSASRNWWASRTREYKELTIVLASRPKLHLIAPANVFADRKSGEITVIEINEEPITQQQAIDRLHALAVEWNWPWEAPAYARWMKAADKGEFNRISAGDKWNSTQTPRVSASIVPAAGTPDRPWYLHWRISWLDEDKPGLPHRS
jgi:hypothetical protein